VKKEGKCERDRTRKNIKKEINVPQKPKGKKQVKTQTKRTKGKGNTGKMKINLILQKVARSRLKSFMKFVSFDYMLVSCKSCHQRSNPN